MSFVGKNVDKALDRTQAPSWARPTLFLLARHANDQHIAWPTQEKMAARLGVGVRQVRNHIRKLEALGEIEVIQRGANRPWKYKLHILSDDVLDRHCGSTPNSEMNRKRTTGPKSARTGTVVSLNRNCGSAEVIEERNTKTPHVFANGEDGKFAEKGKSESRPSPRVRTH